MSINEWKPEYERLSSDKLSLLGVEVIHEFKNGMRILRLGKLQDRHTVLSNIPEGCSLKNRDKNKFEYFKHHSSLDLIEIGLYENIFNSENQSLSESIFRVVLIDSHGNILYENTDIPEEVETKYMLLQMESKSKLELLNHIEKNFKKLYIPHTDRQDLNENRINYYDVLKKKHTEIYETSGSLTLSLKYGNGLYAVLVIDKRTGETLLKSDTALIIERAVETASDNPSMKVIRAIATATYEENKSLIILDDGIEKGYTIDDLTKLKHTYKEDTVGLLVRLHWCLEYIENKVEAKLSDYMLQHGYKEI